jgi:hypothetical protein
MTNLNHQVILRTGDWSNDGHGKTNTISIKSNLSVEDIEGAYKKGCKIVKFDLSEDCCSQYEEGAITDDILKKLRKFPTLESAMDVQGRDDEGQTDSRRFTNLYLAIAKLGKPAFEYAIVPYDNIIDIGGYGLFC